MLFIAEPKIYLFFFFSCIQRKNRIEKWKKVKAEKVYFLFDTWLVAMAALLVTVVHNFIFLTFHTYLFIKSREKEKKSERKKK